MYTLIADDLDIVIRKASKAGIIYGLILSIRTKALTNLEYVGDALFLEMGFEPCRHYQMAFLLFIVLVWPNDQLL